MFLVLIVLGVWEALWDVAYSVDTCTKPTVEVYKTNDEIITRVQGEVFCTGIFN